MGWRLFARTRQIYYCWSYATTMTLLIFKLLIRWRLKSVLVTWTFWAFDFLAWDVSNFYWFQDPISSRTHTGAVPELVMEIQTRSVSYLSLWRWLHHWRRVSELKFKITIFDVPLDTWFAFAPSLITIAILYLCTRWAEDMCTYLCACVQNTQVSIPS